MRGTSFAGKPVSAAMLAAAQAQACAAQATSPRLQHAPARVAQMAAPAFAAPTPTPSAALAAGAPPGMMPVTVSVPALAPATSPVLAPAPAPAATDPVAAPAAAPMLVTSRGVPAWAPARSGAGSPRGPPVRFAAPDGYGARTPSWQPAVAPQVAPQALQQRGTSPGALAGPARGADGVWIRGDTRVVIQGGKILWPDREPSDIRAAGPLSFVTEYAGVLYSAKLEADGRQLRWSDGELWALDVQAAVRGRSCGRLSAGTVIRVAPSTLAPGSPTSFQPTGAELQPRAVSRGRVATPGVVRQSSAPRTFAQTAPGAQSPAHPGPLGQGLGIPGLGPLGPLGQGPLVRELPAAAPRAQSPRLVLAPRTAALPLSGASSQVGLEGC